MNCRSQFLSHTRCHKETSLTQNAVRAAFLLAISYTCMLGGGQAEAQTPVQLATFNFNDATSSATLLAATGGAFKSSSSLSTNFAGADVTSFGGSTVNAQTTNSATDVAGQALALVNQTENGNYLQLQTSSVGYTNLTLSFATQRTGTGFTGNQLSYSTDGTNFTNIATYNPASAFATQSFSLSSTAPTLNNATKVYLKIIFNGASSASGNNRIDNFTLSGTATPAPPGVVSAGIGFAVTGMSALLRRRKQFKSMKAAEATA